jgi:type VI secretion system secreted protein VgrG
LGLELAAGFGLDVRRFRVTERISSLFQISVVAVSDDPDLDFEEVVGHPARFVARAGINPRNARAWSGICTQIQQLSAEETGLSTYEILLAPVLWLATQRRNHRVFQHLSEIEIVRALLAEWGIQAVEKISGSYSKREYRIQHGESDYRFMCRMLEDAGISFYYESEDGATQLVLADAPQGNEARAPIAFRDNPTVADKEHVTGMRATRRVRPGKYTMRDRDYRQPASFSLLSSAGSSGGVEEQLERFHYAPGTFVFQSSKGDGTPVADDKGKYRADQGEAAAMAQRRLAAKRATARSFSFQTNALDIAPGSVLSILDHPKSELAPGKKMLVISSVLSGASNAEWEHACEAVSAEVPYHPPLKTSKPKVTGVESATVVGPPGEEIHCDEFGRVRVHFHWDRASGMDEKSSCWIPVCHPWAGAGFGAVNLPRIGQEVVIDFFGGDPDRPVITGRVYTSAQKIPYTLPANKTQSGWKSNSTGGGGGYNEIMFEDAGGQELFRVQAEKDLSKLVKRDENVTIGHDRSKRVVHDDSLTVGNNRTHVVGSNESITVGLNQSVTIGVNQTETVGADQSVTVLGNQTITLPSGNQTETIIGNRELTLQGNLTETITGHSTLTQVGNQTETLTGNRSLTHTGELSEIRVGSSSLIQLGSDTTVRAGDETLLQLGKQTEVQIGNKLYFQLGAQTEVQIGGRTEVHVGALTETHIGASALTQMGGVTEVVTGDKTLTQTGSNTETVVGNKTITGVTGVEIGSGSSVKVTGATINVEAGGGNTVIKGAIIKLNC